MKNDNAVQFLCKDCDRFNSCEYYYGRKENSYICKNFHLSEVFNNISDEIEELATHDANGILYVSLHRVKKVLEKYKGGDNDGK